MTKVRTRHTTLLKHTWRKEYLDKVCKNCGKLFSRHPMQRSSAWKTTTCCSEECGNKVTAKALYNGLCKVLKKTVCEMCKETFVPRGYGQRYCGGKDQEGTCSWKNKKEKKKRQMAQYRNHHRYYKGVVKFNRGV